jgi:hypothetical protein
MIKFSTFRIRGNGDTLGMGFLITKNQPTPALILSRRWAESQ